MTMLFNDGKFGTRDEQNGQKIYVYEKKKKKNRYISQISGERLHDHWSSGLSL